MSNNYPLGIDISAYQYSGDGKRKPNFDTINAKCQFVAVRAGIASGYTDKWFSYSWERLTVPRMAYHVVYPEESAVSQMEHFLRIVNPSDTDRLVLDMELDHGQGKAKITDTLNQCLEYIRAHTGRYPIVYSRASWVDQFLDVSKLPDIDWWLAHYLKALPYPQFTPEKSPPPALPRGVNNWLIHQTCEKGNGAEFGVASHYVDIDRWNGTEDDILAYFGLIGHPEPEPEPPVPEPPAPEPPAPEPEPEILFRARVYSWATPYVNLRSEPRVAKETDIGDIYPGTIVDVIEVLPDWYRTPDGYIMSKYLERLGSGPPVIIAPTYYGPTYNQRDKRWANEPLGTKSTIGANGCLMVCASMVCNYFGHASNPHQLNDWLTKNDGYYNGNLYVWNALERLYPDMKFDGFVYNPTEAQIIDYIRLGKLPIMLVDFNPSTPEEEMHWVLGIGGENGYIVIADPWTGTMGNLANMYPKPINRFGSYRRVI
jgi:GH25 family lysozyme M1 (1,4-beta-N-acetylmuramidase)